MGRKNLSAEEKMAIVMAGIKGDKTTAQIYVYNFFQLYGGIAMSWDFFTR